MTVRFGAFGRNGARVVLLAAVAASPVGLATAAEAALAISSAVTKNVSCVSNVCTATGTNAVLNVSDLQNMLASGSVTVATGTKAVDLNIVTALTWVSSSTLTLDAYHSITINRPVSVTGSGGLTITNNDGGTGGTFSFGPKGHVNFWSVSDHLTINGNAYTLVNNIATLASDIASNASGFYALAASYDATADGIYAHSPVPTTFGGTFEGLGNTISNLSVSDTTKGADDGLFAETSSMGMVSDLNLTKASIKGVRYAVVGGIVGLSFGSMSGVSVSGNITSFYGYAGGLAGVSNSTTSTISFSHALATIRASQSRVGGLVGANAGTITNCYATGAVHGNQASLGGLVGSNGGTITIAYAMGEVTGTGSINGGLVGLNEGPISNTYAKGNAEGENSYAGGLIGLNGGPVSDSYATGIVIGAPNPDVGGLIGNNNPNGSAADTYWDTTTSGTNTGVGTGDSSGVTGLTTSQLQAGLPSGFDTSIWAESSTINGGLPYLLAIPPG